MPTTDASNPVTPSVATGAGQASTSQQSSQTADFDFDLDFSDTTSAPVSQTSDVDVEVPVAESVNAQVSEEVQAPEVASDLDFSLDLPDSYTSSSAENTEATQSVSGDVPVEVSMPEAQQIAPQPDFGSLLNEESEKTSSDLESPETSEDVHQVVAQEAEDQTFESETSNVPVAQEDASEMEVEAESESEQHQIFSPDQKADSEGEKETFEGEMLTSSMSDEMPPESAESDSGMVSEPIAEAEEESSETLNDGEHEVEFDAEETESDSLPDYEDEMMDDENLDDDTLQQDEVPDLSSEYESFDETPSSEQGDTDTLDAESSVDTISDDSLNVEGDVPQQFGAQQPEMQNTEASQLSSTFSEEVPVSQSGMFMSQPTEAPVAPQESAAQIEESQSTPSVAQGVDLDSMVASAPVAQAEVSSEFPQTVSENAQSAPTQQESTPQMLSLDEMLAQPAAQVSQQVAPVMDLTSLTVGAQNTTNPLTNPTAYPTVQTAGNDGLMKKVLAGVGGVVLVALAGVMVYIKYPLMFGSGEDTPQQPTTQSGTLQPQLALNTSGDQADHFAAGQE